MGCLFRLRAVGTSFMAYFAEQLLVGTMTSIHAKYERVHPCMSDTAVLSTSHWCLHVDVCVLKVKGDGSCFSLCDFMVSMIEGKVATLVPTPTSFVLGHAGMPTFHEVLDLCCGLGGMSVGASLAGLQVLSAVDCSPWAVEVYNRNHAQPAFVGDIASLQVVKQLSEAIQCRNVGCMLGFPCPPFSSMGDQAGFKDPRAWTFVHGLNLAYLLHASFVLLECTPLVETHAEIRTYLDLFVAATSYGWKSCILRLDRAWPTRRTRWWAIIAPLDVCDALDLPDLPFAADLQKISALLPRWPSWSREAEQDLHWDQDELDFHAQFADIQALRLRRDGQCPTLLHSLGHLDRQCPCGCRQRGLSCSRLFRDGISTVALGCDHLEGLRHLHPCEAGFLCTLPSSFVFTECRDSLPLIGQMAAPLQAHWVLSQFLKAIQIDQGFPLEQCVEPTVCHSKLQAFLIHQALHLWPTKDTAQDYDVTFRFDSGCSLTVRVSAHTFLADFIEQQRALGGWLVDTVVSMNGVQVPHGAILKPGIYDLTTAFQPLNLENSYVLRHKGQCWTGHFVHGVTLDALLVSLGFPLNHHLTLCCPDRHIGSHMTLHASVTGSLQSFFVGGGDDDFGLSNFQIDAEAARLMRQVRLPEDFVYLSALDLSQLLTCTYGEIQDGIAALVPPTAQKVFGIFCFDGHWSAFAFDRPATQAYFFDGYEGLTPAAEALIHVLADLWNLPDWHVFSTSLLQQSSGHHCGVITLVNFGHFLGLWTSFEEADALAWFHRLMFSYVGSGQVEYNRIHAKLVAELPKHGVPAVDAPGRAVAAIKKLSLPALAKALDSKNVWQALKALGNASERPFQWVTHSELEKHVNARAADKKAPMGKVKKVPDRKPRAIQLAPDQVCVPDDAFVDENSEPVLALCLDGISQDARGVIVVAADDAVRFLKDSKTRSVDALALLTLTEIDVPPECPLDCCQITWPGLLVETQEPLLIKGTCIQLGDVRVNTVVHDSMSPSVVENDLIKLFVYRDQWPHDWNDFSKGPLRALIAQFPCLQFCTCGLEACSKFHPAVEEPGIHMVVLDAFAWKWHDATGNPAKQGKAHAFSLMIRIPKSGTQAVLAASGHDGLYTELRAGDHNGTHAAYAVVWIQEDFDAARHRLRSTDGALHLVRFHSKYGLRCLKKDEKSVHQALFPTSKFVDCGTALQFEVGPWPCGATKSTIAGFLDGLSWLAKPLKPTRGDQHGRFWLVGSSTDPPVAIAPFADQFVTITKTRDLPTSRPAPAVVASVKTLQRLTQSASSSASTDPWLKQDPWKDYGKDVRAAPPMAQPSQASSKLDEIEGRLTSKLVEQVQEQIRSVHADQVQDDAARLDKLEVNMQELQSQQHKFNHWCSEAAGKIEHITKQVTAQQEHLVTIDASVAENAAATGLLGTQIQTMGQSFQMNLQAAMDKQTASLEALFAKKDRSRSPR